MLKGRLNNSMRVDMHNALLEHAYGAREAVLDAEAVELRNEAIRQLLTPAQIKACETLLPLLAKGEYGYNHQVYWGDRVSVNCGGPKIHISFFGSDVSEPIDGSIPVLRILGDLRLDLAGDDDLAVRVSDWAGRREALRSEKKVSAEQVRAALAAFSTVNMMETAWPQVMPVVTNILVEHLGRPAPTLPAVVLTEMNEKLGLPPGDNENVRELEAA
jgi:hypothetical protein